MRYLTAKLQTLIAVTLLLAFVLLITACGDTPQLRDAQSDLQPQTFALGAFYYPWYEASRWQNTARTHEPLRGLYRSRDKAVLRGHLEDCRQAGISFLLYSWWGRDSEEDKTLSEDFLPAIAKTEINFAILYETAGTLPLEAGQPLDFALKTPTGKTVGDLFCEDVEYLARNYFAHPRYQKIGGQPLLYIYLVRDIRNGGPYLSRARNFCREQGLDLFLVADLVYLDPAARLNWPEIAANFKAVTGYNMYFQGLDPEAYLGIIREKFAEYQALADRYKLIFIPNIQPGYDDSPLRGQERMVALRAEGQFYRDYWRLSEDFLDRQWPLMLLTSFNEWHEGTEIEASKEFGESYLHLTRDLVRNTEQNLTFRPQ